MGRGRPEKVLNDDRIKALAGKIGDEALARIIGCNKETILKRRWKLGIPGSLKHYDWPVIFEAVKSGVPVRVVADGLGLTSKCDRVVIYTKLRTEGIVYPKRLRSIPKPTRAQLEKLIEFYDLPRKYAAKLIGVSEKTIKKWKERYNLAELRAHGEADR